LVLAGIVFTLTASAYAVTAIRQLDTLAAAAAASPDAGSSLIQFLDRYGAGLMFGELVLLAGVAAAAVATERCRTGGKDRSPDGDARSQLEQYPTQRRRRAD
jgi:hypothetical protein